MTSDYHRCEKCGTILWKKGKIIFCPNCGVVDDLETSEIPKEKLSYV